MKNELSDFRKEVTKHMLELKKTIKFIEQEQIVILDKKIGHLSNIILLLEQRMDTIQKDSVEPMLSSNLVLLEHIKKLSKGLEE